uniref:Uncharacterized protein LOC109505414 n=1 Tax=Elaeis guineensis var. tenera TaxID=51953 RepID=A0A6J0PEB8_ELAGV
MVLLLIYVDDIILTGTSGAPFTSLLVDLSRKFVVKDLDPLHYFFGIEAVSNSYGLHLTQSKYIHDVLTHCAILDCKPLCTPIVAGSYLSLFDGDLFDNPSLYRSVVGSLQYLTVTKLDIAYVVNQ